MDKKTKQIVVLVLGGNGFIGSQVVKSLKARAKTIIGTRKTTTDENMLTVRMQSMMSASDWMPLLDEVDVVVNSVGILRERKNESYEQVHNMAVKSLAFACENLGISLVHVSAIGLSDKAGSGFIRSKFYGEQAITASGAQSTIVRASLLDGEGGYGAKWFRMVAAWPIQFVMQSKGLVAPLQVSDLGQAIANLVLMPVDQRPKVAELGGSEVYGIPSYLNQLRRKKGLGTALQISMPKFLVRIASHIFDVFDWTPLSFGHYELMQGYNVPQENALPRLLGRKPSPVGECVDIVKTRGKVAV